MRKRVRRRHDAHLRAQSVCAEHRDVFGATPGGRKARTAFDTYVTEVDRLLALQQRSVEDRRAATAQCRQSRRSLRDAAKAVVSVGRIVHLDAAVMDTMHAPGAANDEEPKLLQATQNGKAA